MKKIKNGENQVENKKKFPLFIRKQIEHKGIKVTYQIDFKLHLISLVEDDWRMKRWLFQNRWLSYMNWWKNILEAMKVAIEQAEKELKEYQDYRDKYILENAVVAYKSITLWNEK